MAWQLWGRWGAAAYRLRAAARLPRGSRTHAARQFVTAIARPRRLSANPALGALPEATDEPRYGWAVVWATFVALAVIFGVAYSFAAFFEPFVAEFKAQRADVSL